MPDHTAVPAVSYKSTAAPAYKNKTAAINKKTEQVEPQTTTSTPPPKVKQRITSAPQQSTHCPTASFGTTNRCADSFGVSGGAKRGSSNNLSLLTLPPKGGAAPGRQHQLDSELDITLVGKRVSH